MINATCHDYALMLTAAFRGHLGLVNLLKRYENMALWEDAVRKKD